MPLGAKNYCLAKKPDYYREHSLSNRGLKLTIVQFGSCDTNYTPCSAYTSNYRLACVVCSKL